MLKLDRGFVAELDGTSRGGAVAQAVLRLGQILNLDTVAEGVESEAQARELTLLGCPKAQGVPLRAPIPARPVPAVAAGRRPVPVRGRDLGTGGVILDGPWETTPVSASARRSAPPSWRPPPRPCSRRCPPPHC
ncbi:EAL domain-containing protein [Dactylosporangium sp. NPDC048998]|uniref:EAL domain-containing protein n=1 Tax=Dactylosporangium sp. NPDC048998 TaxID=3363976 RepID=UPI00371FF76F